jgi:outer membrane protein OmpA-like peptidoglycan-associated protein
MTAAEEIEQFRAATILTSLNKRAGRVAMKRLTSEHPESAWLWEKQHKMQEADADMPTFDENTEAFEADMEAIDAANRRFAGMDDYYVRDQVAIQFASGESVINPRYYSKLLALTERAKSLDRYIVEIIEYRESRQSNQLNQQRTVNVLDFVAKKGGIPFTHILAPSAMANEHAVNQQNQGQQTADLGHVVLVRVLQLQPKPMIEHP